MNLLARSACKETRTDHELSFRAFTTWILFYSFVLWLFFISGTQSQGYWGGEPPTFLEENCFCLSIRDMLKAEYLSFYTLSRLRVLERYLIENVANTMSESRFLNFLGGIRPDHPLPPRNSRLRREFLRAAPSWNCAPSSLLMTLYGYFQRNQSRDDRLRCGRSTRY